MASVIRIRTLIVLAAALLSAGVSSAYQLSPRGSAREVQLERLRVSRLANGSILLYSYGVGLFKGPVHEEITVRMWGCETLSCDQVEKHDVPTAVLAGVRWNDDPRFSLTNAQASGTVCDSSESIRVATQPICWVQLFKRAERGAAAGKKYGPGDPLLFCTHFGDLQFLHSMAAVPGEDAEETRRKMLDWAEFTWRTSAGEYELETKLKSIPIPTIQERFGRTEWRVLDLLTHGNSSIRSELRHVAFGSLLHVIQDSFAAGHVDRQESSGLQMCGSGNFVVAAPGKVNEFHAYNNQDHQAHDRADSQMAMLLHIEREEGDAVQIGRALRKYYQANSSWESVRPFLECVFALEEHPRPAGSGDSFTKNGRRVPAPVRSSIHAVTPEVQALAQQVAKAVREE